MKWKKYECWHGAEMIVSGTAKQVADFMGITPDSVRSHVFNMKKRKNLDGYYYDWYVSEDYEIHD